MKIDTFQTTNLFGERLSEAHWGELCRMHQDPLVMATLGGLRDDATTRAYMDHNLAHWSQYGHGLWIVRDLATRDMVGRAVVRHLTLDDIDEVEIGYALNANYWGRGLATELALECVRIAFNDLNLPSVVAITLPTNLASQRVMTKAGLTFEREFLHGGSPHVLFRRLNEQRVD